MILTGNAIERAVEKGEIVIEPFEKKLVNPNSYNYRMFDKVLKVSMDHENLSHFEELILDDSGLILEPGTLYLGATYEIIGSIKYVTTLLGRSSIGRLGLFLNVTADLGHTGAISRWTLEMKVVQPLRIYPFMRIGQVAFWLQTGIVNSYLGKYQGDLRPFPNKDESLLRRIIQEKLSNDS